MVRGKANGKNIFLGIFLYLERGSLTQTEHYDTAVYPYLKLMVLFNWLMKNGYFQCQGQLILLADYHY